MMKIFTIPEDDWNAIAELSAKARDTPVIMVGGVDMSRSARERVFAKWREVGQKLGFDAEHIEPGDESKRQIKAEPLIGWTAPICDKPMAAGTMDGEAVVCGKPYGHEPPCGDWTGSTSRDGDTVTVIPESGSPEAPALQVGDSKPRVIQIRFAGDQPNLTFVEVEDREGRGLSVGTWESDGDYQLLVIEIADEEVETERFSDETIGHDGRPFLAFAMEGTETAVDVKPFSAQIDIETRRAKMTLSFEDADAAIAWLASTQQAMSNALAERLEEA